MGEVFLDAFLDTLKVLPFLLVMNFIIELVEYRSKGLKANKILKGGIAPLIGTAVGVVPQCGFSVVATELYSRRRIALGTLLAVYLATSDEAIPIMLSSYDGLVKLWPIVVIKVCFAIIVGYSVFGIEKLLGRKTDPEPAEPARVFDEHVHEQEHGGEYFSASDAQAGEQANVSEHEHADDPEPEHEHAHDHDDVSVRLHGCHHHELENSDVLDIASTAKQKAAWFWRVYLKHPVIHTATVILFIFAVNILFGIAVYFVGEARLADFIGTIGYLQPALAALVGLIPNCAASVVITELYVVGGLNLGGAVAGLCVSAGIGYAVLVKQNRPVKNTLLVIAIMYTISVALGMSVIAITGAFGLYA